MIDIGKLDNNKILINTCDKLPDDIALRDVATLIIYIKKDDLNINLKYS